MQWIKRKENILRLAALALFLAAVIGPWAFSSDGVPPPEWCAAPNYLLKSGYCARQVSGLWIFIFLGGVFYVAITLLASGEAFQPDRIVEVSRMLLFSPLLIMLILPFFTTLLKVLRRDSRFLRIAHLFAWGIAGVLGALLILSDEELHSGRYWGIWLYCGLAFTVLILEAAQQMAYSRRAPSQL